MAKSQIFCLFVLAALLSVGMMGSIANAICYEIHPEISCVDSASKDNCLAFCQNKFGPNTTYECHENVGFDGPFCVCDLC